jgi:transposase-like protein
LEHDLAVYVVVQVARQYRDAGIRWATLARAIGINASTLRAWRRRDHHPKEILPAPTVPPNIMRRSATPTRAEAAQRTSLSTTDIHNESQITNLTTTSNSMTTASLSVTTDAAAVRPPRRRVLVLTGDPRPGGNLFDPEVAFIRDRLQATTIGHRHVAMIGLSEVSSSIDQERPAVLHICAHRGSGGIALSLEGTPFFIDPHDLGEAIERARHSPRCAVLNFCSSEEIARRLTPRMPAVIAWPGPVEDAQTACFARELYQQIATGIRLHQCVAEAAHVITTCWPQLEAPVLHGTWHDPVM